MDDSRSMRTVGLWCIIGSVILTVGAIVSALLPSAVPATDVSAPLTPGVFRIAQLTWAACHLLVFLATVAFARSGAFGSSRLGRVGGWIAAAGMAVVAICEVGFALIATDTVDSGPATLLNSAIGLGSTVAGLGFLLAGIAVLRAGRWGGWQRFVPLLCGLYVFVVLTPGLVAFSGAFFWVLAGWSACFVLLGLALARQQPQPRQASLSSVPA